MTQLDIAKSGKVSKEVRLAAKDEPVTAEKLRKLIASGKAVLPANELHKKLKPMAIGQGLKTKVNANIGTSQMNASLKKELEKMDIAIKYGYCHLGICAPILGSPLMIWTFSTCQRIPRNG